MAYKDKEKERDYQKAYNKAYYQSHKVEKKAYKKAYYQSHREEQKAYQKAYNQSHREEQNARDKAYKRTDTNTLGQTKSYIRKKSNYYLFNVLKHTKVEGYEIHHCFGYEDHRNFIYIPKELHLQIHQYLRDNCIDADTDHYSKIAQLIINYIKCNEKHILILKQSQ